jgi:hypothetical protein
VRTGDEEGRLNDRELGPANRLSSPVPRFELTPFNAV